MEARRGPTGPEGSLQRAPAGYLVVVLHVLQVALLTDEQVQILLPVCMHGLHVSLPERVGHARRVPGALGEACGIPNQSGGERSPAPAYVWLPRGGRLFPMAGRGEGGVSRSRAGLIHRCLGCTGHEAQEGLCLPKVVLLKELS